jgi:hypothetical protein
MASPARWRTHTRQIACSENSRDVGQPRLFAENYCLHLQNLHTPAANAPAPLTSASTIVGSSGESSHPV